MEWLGEYEVLGVLAHGGMADLMLARRSSITGPAQLVVIKRILPALARDADFAHMLLDEARIAASLHHRNIVKVHAVGDDRGLPYLVMELLLGHDVCEVASRAAELGHRLRPDLATEIAIATCTALHYAHERRDAMGVPLDLVHRDVSPHNVFVTYDGEIKLLDFGVARTTTSSGRTRTGIAKGKVAYMSPEQAYCRAIDRRSDIFSLGIMLWELTTGRRLYARRSELETLKALVDRPPPRPSTVVPDYPEELEAIVMRCLARDRNDRWSTCDELAGHLEAFARRHGSLDPRSAARAMRALFPDEVAAYASAVTSPETLAAFALARVGPVIEEPDGYEQVVVEPASLPRLEPPRRRRRRVLIAGFAVACIAVAALRLAPDDGDAAMVRAPATGEIGGSTGIGAAGIDRTGVSMGIGADGSAEIDRPTTIGAGGSTGLGRTTIDRAAIPTGIGADGPAAIDRTRVPAETGPAIERGIPQRPAPSHVSPSRAQRPPPPSPEVPPAPAPPPAAAPAIPVNDRIPIIEPP